MVGRRTYLLAIAIVWESFSNHANAQPASSIDHELPPMWSAPSQPAPTRRRSARRGALPVPPSAPTARPIARIATTGLRVAEVRGRKALITLPLGTTIQVGQHVAIRRIDPRTGRWTAMAVGVVAIARSEGAVVVFGRDERVFVGDEAEVTTRRRTSSYLAPRHRTGFVRAELGVGTGLAVPAILGEARVAYHGRLGLAFAQLLPSGYVAIHSNDGVPLTAPAGVGAVFGGGIHSRYLTLAVGLGGVQSRSAVRFDRLDRGQAVLALHFRLGALDGLSFAVDAALPLTFDGPQAATHRYVAGIYLPLAPFLLLGVRGGVWTGGPSYAELDVPLRARLHGDDGGGSWYLTVAPGLLWTNTHRFAAPTGPDPYVSALPIYATLRVGVEARFGSDPRR